jgi:glycosyltransferase involved in cell wall biosynthesis
MSRQLAIVIPAFKATYLKQALESVLQQTDNRFRVYVGDDASPEPVGDIVRGFGLGADKLLYHRFAENLGGTSLVRQWARCIRLSNEPWVWLFSDDDVMDPGCVAAFYRELESAGDSFDLCRFNNNTLWMNGAGQLQTENPSHPENETGSDFLLARLRDERTSTAQELIFSRAGLARIGGIPEFPLAWTSDDAFIAKMGVRRPIRTISGPRITWRVSGQNITHKKTTQTGSQKMTASRMFVQWTQQFLTENPPSQGLLRADELTHLTERWFFHQAYFSRRYLGFEKCVEIDRFASAVWHRPRGYGFARSLKLNCQLAGSRVFTICKRILGLPGKCLGALKQRQIAAGS